MAYKKFELRYKLRNDLTHQILLLKLSQGIKINEFFTSGLMAGGIQTVTWWLSDGSKYETFRYNNFFTCNLKKITV